MHPRLFSTPTESPSDEVKSPINKNSKKSIDQSVSSGTSPNIVTSVGLLNPTPSPVSNPNSSSNYTSSQVAMRPHLVFRTSPSPSTPLKKVQRRAKSFYIDMSTIGKRNHSRSKSLGNNKYSLPESLISNLEARMSRLQLHKVIRSLLEPMEDIDCSTLKPQINRDLKRTRHITFPTSVNSSDMLAVFSRAQHARAKIRRERQLKAKRLRLRIENKHKAVTKEIQKEKEQIKKMRLRVQMDLSIQTADFKRQLILQRKSEKHGAEVNRAQGISLLSSLGKRLGLIRSMSASFTEELRNMEYDEEEYEAEEVNVSTPPGFSCVSNTSSTTSPLAGSPAGQALRNAFELAGNPPLIASVKATSPLAEHDPGAPSPVRRTFQRLSLSQKGEMGVLKRSKSAPSIVSVKSIITQMHLGINPGLPVTIHEMLPPITRYTLRELEFDQIMSSIQLRHDLIFDSNMHFTQNDAEDKIDHRTQRTKTFFAQLSENLKKMKAEIEGGQQKEKMTLEDYFKRPYFLAFPVLINEVKEIMLDMLPYSRAFNEELNDHLDIDLIAQEMEHNVFNPTSLISYIVRTLKLHCAPMRDASFDELVGMCQEGKLVETIKRLFELLEIMKLDVANSQLRSIRPQVIEEAVQFEWNYFKDQLSVGLKSTQVMEKWFEKFVKIEDPFSIDKNMDNSKSLLRKSASTANISSIEKKPGLTRTNSVPLLNQALIDSTTPLGTPKLSGSNFSLPEIESYASWKNLFYKAFLFIISSCNSAGMVQELPETLYLDINRLHSFHNEWQDITIIACLIILFKQAAGPQATVKNEEIKKELLVLLDDSDTTLSHLTLHIVASAEKARGKLFTENERSILLSTMDKSLSPDSPLFDMLHARVALHLFLFLKEGKTVPELLTKHGLTEVADDITELATDISAVVHHNSKTYEPLYTDLAKKLKLV